MRSTVALAAVGAALGAPVLFTDFQEGALTPFVLSEVEKYAGQPVTVQVPAGLAGQEGNVQLLLQKGAKHYAITAPLDAPLKVVDEPLVLQYEVRLPEGLQCGGAYVKLYEAEDDGFDAADVTNETPYLIMFGPDHCGSTDKVHLIIRWRNPISGTIEEKHLKTTPRPRTDKLPHLYTLVIRPDDTFSIKIDNKEEVSGSLLETDIFSPPIQPPETVPDVMDKKPADWVDEKTIVDLEARKPEDWDEEAPLMIPDEDATKPAGWLDNEPDHVPDPQASKPEDWDDDEDGEWEAPVVANPKCESAPGCGEWKRPTKRNPAYKGKWSAPIIPNPAYKGEWAPRQVPNPLYHKVTDAHRMNDRAIAALGVEVWTMQPLSFDNFLVTKSEQEASDVAEKLWRPRRDAQEAAVTKEIKDKKRKEKAEKAATGDFFDKVTYWIEEGQDFLVARPLVALATLVALLVSMVGSCLALTSRRGSEFQPSTRDLQLPAESSEEPEKADAAADEQQQTSDDVSADATETSAAGDGAEEAAESAETEEKPSARRRKARRAD